MSLVTITEDNFQTMVLEAEKPVVVDFWAPWCVPCQMFGPILEETSGDFADSVVIGKFNVDESIKISRQYKVLSIPTIIMFKNGEVIKKHSGVLQKEQLAAWISEGI